MLEIEIPGWRHLTLEHLVLDVNGTIALDGELLPGIVERIETLRPTLRPHLLSGDTHGTLDAISARLGAGATRASGVGSAAEEKGIYIRGLGAGRVVAIGNGANDEVMLREAALGIAILGVEGLAGVGAAAADILVRSIDDALDLLIHPLRLIASLRR